MESGLLRPNYNWYDDIKLVKFEKEITYKTLGMQSSDISKIKLVKRNLDLIVVEALDDTTFNNEILIEGKYYKIEYQFLDRNSNKGEGYFFFKKN